ncbi:MAG: glycosyltransferase family 39 protein [Myxococcota bacterium]|jgi:hypothetical protein|nr:hypothetical protein [bacterium]MDP7074499.1 glycosyltransferase family 39 protein [Myxococcota bacterium]MDP7301332.1 glycosyltransferase family 39 protein [Myxococcota bacterium]MDP7431606.1 glycosyltransferase family 39 protein [Myxococcota bacterium]HJO24684.1 glycosyltransferase family 39 protein [Myxococcota bacterium]
MGKMDLHDRSPLDSEPQDGTRRVAYVLFALAGILALGLAWLPVEVTIGTFLYEDMFYYLTLAEHAVGGQGVSFDGTTATNGLHPLWMLLCVALASHLEGMALVHAVLTVAALLHVAQGWLLWDLLRRHTSPAIALAIAGFWLFSYRVLASNLCGLETPLATLAVLVVLRLLLDGSARGQLGSGVALGLSLGFAVLSRFDLLLLASVVLVWVAWDRRLGRLAARRVATSLGAAAIAGLVLVPWFVWSLGQSGVLLPNSHVAVDLMHDVHYDWRDPAAALSVLSQQLLNGAWWATQTANLLGVWPLPMPRTPPSAPAYWMGVSLLFLLMLSALPVGLVYGRHQPASRLALPALGFASLHTAWYVLFIEPEVRYLMPALAAAFVGAGLVVHAVLQTNRARWLRVALAGAFAGLFLSASVGGVLAWRAGYGTTFTHRNHLLLLEAARHLRRNTPPGTTVGAWNSGILGYFSGRTVVNLDGVVNDDAVDALREKRLLAYIRERRIDVLVDLPHQVEAFLSRFGGVADWQLQLEPLGTPFEDASGRRVIALRVLPLVRDEAQPPTR